MTTTPDRFPGDREEEILELQDDAAGDPAGVGQLKYVSGAFRQKDAIGVFDPRYGEGVIIESGFTNIGGAADSVLAFVDGTRTLSIQPSVTSYEVWCGGARYTKTSLESVVITDVEGVHWVYFDDDGVLTHTVTGNEELILQYALVAFIYWDAANKVSVLFNDERHGRQMSAATHLWAHEAFGTVYETGLALGDITAGGDGDSASHAQLSVSNGEIRDEDIDHGIVDGSPQSLASPAEIPVFYRSGAAGWWRKVTATTYPITTTGTGRAAWNEWTGVTWQLTEVSNNDYVLMHIFATADQRHPIIAITGQNTYLTAPAAEAGALVELGTLNFGTLHDTLPELLPIGTLIFQTGDGKANAVKSSIEFTASGADYVDWRTTGVSGSGGGSSTDDAAIHDNVVGEINAITAKASPVGADVLIIEDSAASWAKKSVTISNLPGGADADAIHDNVAAEIAAVTEKGTPVAADLILIEDSAAANVKKRAQLSNVGKAIKLDDLAAPDDNTDLDSTTSLHGLLPKLGGGSSNFLRADGTWAAPPGGVDTTALHKATAGEIAAMTAKATPVSADLVVIEDSAASDAKKKATLASIFAILSPGPCFDGYDTTGGTNVSSGAAVPLDTERQKTTDFTHSTSTANSEVTIAVAGKYVISGDITTNVSVGTARYDSYGWLELDTGSGFAEVPGTRVTMYNRQATIGINTGSFRCVLDLDVDDKLRLWAARRTGTGTIVLYADGSRLVITAMRGPAGADGADGADGATGATGAGANIIVKDDTVTVGTVMDTINFGTGLAVTNDGSGDCTVDAAGGAGPEEYSTWDPTGAATSSTTFQTAETLTFTPDNAGEDWLIEWSCEWKVDDADERCYTQILVDGATVINEHYDPGLVNTRYSMISGAFQLSALSAASHTVAVQYRPLNNWTTMTIKNIFIRARSLG